jgi:hypothetical protein
VQLRLGKVRLGYAECRYAQRLYTECRGARSLTRNINRLDHFLLRTISDELTYLICNLCVSASKECHSEAVKVSGTCSIKLFTAVTVAVA